MGALQDDASLAARRVVFETMALYAAPGYVARRGLPAHPDDLLGHDLLCLPRRAGATNWHLTRGKVSWERELSPRVSANSPELLLQVARAGVGIAGTSNVYAAAYVARGDLVRVLPEWDLPSVTGWAVFPGRRLMPAKTRAFLDLLEELCCEDGRAAP